LKALAERVEASAPVLQDATAKRLLGRVRAALKEASDDRVLGVSQYEIHRYVNFADPPPQTPRLLDIHAIAGGVKDFSRARESIQLCRTDGAWFHFTLLVQEHRRDPMRLLAYDFELVYPDGHLPWFVRFDLNLPGHPNAARGVRSHLHPGRDDLLVPAPILEPLEAIQLMLSLPIVHK
jgi:hypothetical protein